MPQLSRKGTTVTFNLSDTSSSTSGRGHSGSTLASHSTSDNAGPSRRYPVQQDLHAHVGDPHNHPHHSHHQRQQLSGPHRTSHYEEESEGGGSLAYLDDSNSNIHHPDTTVPSHRISSVTSNSARPTKVERPTSETTIFSIYSMYEDKGGHSTFAATGSVDSHLASLKQRASMVGSGNEEDHAPSSSNRYSTASYGQPRSRESQVYPSNNAGNDQAHVQGDGGRGQRKVTPSSYRPVPNGPRQSTSSSSTTQHRESLPSTSYSTGSPEEDAQNGFRHSVSLGAIPNTSHPPRCPISGVGGTGLGSAGPTPYQHSSPAGQISPSTSSTSRPASTYMSARNSLHASSSTATTTTTNFTGLGLDHREMRASSETEPEVHRAASRTPPSRSSSKSRSRKPVPQFAYDTPPETNRDLPAIPPPSPLPSTALLTPPQPLSTQLPPSPAPSTPGPSSSPQPKATPKTPQSNTISPLLSSALSTPASLTSLVPSEGEDQDAFHVRHTYAVLDTIGVRGDGYEEGVERTRARIGASRRSQLDAEAALGSGDEEKRKELGEEERKMLAGLDRYGFYSLPTHDRLVLLPSAPFLKRLSPSKPGPPASPTALSSLPPTPPISPKETSRIAKWTRMLIPRGRDEGGNADGWRVKGGKERKLWGRVYKGVPDRWRSAAWEMLVEGYAAAPPPGSVGGKDGGKDRLEREFRDALDRPSTYDVQIDLDVPRTISGHVMFKTRYGAGQRALFQVLHSFSQRCETCGYVQGMGPIAATLLCYLSPSATYTALVRLHSAYSLHSIFAPGFPGLLEAIYVQEKLIESYMPAVYESFKKNMVGGTAYATKWYITLFANSVPFQMQLRVWDAFLVDGPDVLVVVAVGIVWAYRDHITSPNASFETILSLLSSFFVPEDEDAVINWIGKVLADKGIRDSMRRWRTSWGELVRTGKDKDALL